MGVEIIGTQTDLSERERAALVKERLRLSFRYRSRTYRLNSRETSGTGRAYTDEAVDAGELACALGRCTPRQQRVLELWLGPRRLHQARVARELGVSVVTVKRDASAAVRTMVAMIWEE